jgi:multicomponent K+:H+ antiporter subunit G
MISAIELITAVLVTVGAAITLIGALGLLSLHSFYERVHAPTLGTTLGTTCIVFSSMIYFWAQGTHFVLDGLLIIALLTATTPVTLMVLVRAAVLRDRYESKEGISYTTAYSHRQSKQDNLS